MRRLYQVTANNEGVKLGPSELAKSLNESPQVIKNWESRGISIAGALKAQEKFECNANWLLEKSSTPDMAQIAHHGIIQQPLRVAEPPAWEWPFQLVERHRYMALPDAEKHQAQVRMMDEIKALEIKLAQANGTSNR